MNEINNPEHSQNPRIEPQKPNLVTTSPPLAEREEQRLAEQRLAEQRERERSMDPAKPGDPAKPAVAVKHEEKPLDKSFVGSLARIAAAWRKAPVWDSPTAAKALENEADLLEPKRVSEHGHHLAQRIREAEARIAKAKAVLANPHASRGEHDRAVKELTGYTA
jgi:hypothetical protein